MTKLYIKEHVFTLGDKFTVKDEYGNDKYFVEGEVFTLGKKLHIYDTNRNEVAFIEQQLLTFLPRYNVFCNGEQVAEIKKEFSFIFPVYNISGPDWHIEGDFTAHDYTITQDGTPIVSINKEWMTWGDSYELNITNNSDEILALAVVIAIDCVTENNSGVSVSFSTN